MTHVRSLSPRGGDLSGGVAVAAQLSVPVDITQGPSLEAARSACLSAATIWVATRKATDALASKCCPCENWAFLLKVQIRQETHTKLYITRIVQCAEQTSSLNTPRPRPRSSLLPAPAIAAIPAGRTAAPPIALPRLPVLPLLRAARRPLRRSLARVVLRVARRSRPA